MFLTEEDKELAKKWSKILCLHPMNDGVYCVNNIERCNGGHMFTGCFGWDVVAVLELAYKLRMTDEHS